VANFLVFNKVSDRAIPSLRPGGKQAYLLDIEYRKIIAACSIEKTAPEGVQNTTLIAGYFDGISL